MRRPGFVEPIGATHPELGLVPVPGPALPIFREHGREHGNRAVGKGVFRFHHIIGVVRTEIRWETRRCAVKGENDFAAHIDARVVIVILFRRGHAESHENNGKV